MMKEGEPGGHVAHFDAGRYRRIGSGCQWGRKDPFIGHALSAPQLSSTAFQDQTAKTASAPGYEWKVGVIRRGRCYVTA